MYFASDNAAPVHPEVMQALQHGNQGYAMPYGNDPAMQAARDAIRDVFEAPAAAVCLVATGTAANALALAACCPPWGAVYCHRLAHINDNECGAPEFYTGGAKLVLVDGPRARMDPDALCRAIKDTPRDSVHKVKPGIVSITNVTECGAVCSVAEIAGLAAIAHAHGLPVHMDGARLANALAATDASPADMTWRAGVDLLSFGGTKNGLMGVEAVVMFDPARAWEVELRRKRGGHLFSKHRYLALQMSAYLQDGLWLKMAQDANRAAKRLAEGLGTISHVRIHGDVMANIVFAEWARHGHKRLHQAGARYYITTPGTVADGEDDDRLGARLVASWSTRDQDIDRFLDLVRG